jgi:uncharacterized iron-regulated protein
MRNAGPRLVSRRNGLLWAAAPLALAGCASAGPTLVLPPDKPLVLLGEVHDNAAGHALRLRAFDAMLARGARPALLMEQLDRDLQPRVDALRQREPQVTAAALLAALSPPGGWDWGFYTPFIERALGVGLPVVAVNIGRDDARRIIREGLAAHGFDAAVPDDVLVAQARAIEASHCGQVDAALARRMALAQVARDQQMARALTVQRERGAVLLAGNGHVRRDIGVPRWLDEATRARSVSVGVLERGQDVAPFDVHAVVAAQPRPDPCEALERRP